MAPTKKLKTTHLSTATRRWYDAIEREYELESHHKRILLTAAEMWDRAAEARAAIEKTGLMVTDRYGQLKVNPAVECERSSKVLFLRAVRELGLDVEAPGEIPPVITGRA
ncbi:MAG: P27 family phage terminase small subunit [Planctomycetaceae bacterium]|nr:P27 family phage terminase small subunit [Planctomycetaceae bacterium]